MGMGRFHSFQYVDDAIGPLRLPRRCGSNSQQNQHKCLFYFCKTNKESISLRPCKNVPLAIVWLPAGPNWRVGLRYCSGKVDFGCFGWFSAFFCTFTSLGIEAWMGNLCFVSLCCQSRGFSLPDFWRRKQKRGLSASSCTWHLFFVWPLAHTTSLTACSGIGERCCWGYVIKLKSGMLSCGHSAGGNSVWVSKWRWKFWQCRSFIFIASQSPIAGNAETALSVIRLPLGGSRLEICLEVWVGHGNQRALQSVAFSHRRSFRQHGNAPILRKRILHKYRKMILLPLCKEVDRIHAKVCFSLWLEVTAVFWWFYASLARRGWLLDVGAFYEFLEDGPCRYLDLSFFLWLFFTNAVNQMPLWNMHCVLVDASKSAIMFWVQKQQGFPPRWCGQAFLEFIFSNDTVQNDDRFDKLSKFVAACIHRLCVI